MFVTYILHNFGYLLCNIERLSGKDYIPEANFVLGLRHGYTLIYEKLSNLNKNVELR